MSSSASPHPLWAGSPSVLWVEIPQISWPLTRLVKYNMTKVMRTYIYKSKIRYQGLYLSDDSRLSASIERLQHDVKYRFFLGFLLHFISGHTAVPNQSSTAYLDGFVCGGSGWRGGWSCWHDYFLNIQP